MGRISAFSARHAKGLACRGQRIPRRIQPAPINRAGVRLGGAFQNGDGRVRGIAAPRQDVLPIVANPVTAQELAKLKQGDASPANVVTLRPGQAALPLTYQ